MNACRQRHGYQLAALVLPGLLAACATGPPPAFGPRPDAEVRERLPFLREGLTTRAEVEARLGEPDGRFDDGATLTYVLVGTEAGSVRLWQRPGDAGGLPGLGRPRPLPGGITLPGSPADPPDLTRQFELVLSFDPGGRLARRSLVEKPGLLDTPQ